MITVKQLYISNMYVCMYVCIRAVINQNQLAKYKFSQTYMYSNKYVCVHSQFLNNLQYEIIKCCNAICKQNQYYILIFMMYFIRECFQKLESIYQDSKQREIIFAQFVNIYVHALQIQKHALQGDIIGEARIAQACIYVYRFGNLILICRCDNMIKCYDITLTLLQLVLVKFGVSHQIRLINKTYNIIHICSLFYMRHIGMLVLLMYVHVI
eukprot:TRINITY_DN3244_c0_g2_i2.p1 TRINITY_DN3244_c0_g2~~TRINITY_DN3244_c0_g2_i2.p1  ORF type:complete len:211 (-),score=-19.17 TRINITY_DN3244_c0_g2_i2:170-802(-)